MLDFLKTFDKAKKCIQIPLTKLKIEIVSTKSKSNVLAHYYKDVIQHSSKQIHSSFRFQNNSSCVFTVKEFALHGNQHLLTEIVNLNRRENHNIC